jgi:hypothetical protein
MSKLNLIGQPVFVPRGYSINEFDVSTGILKPSRIPQQVIAKLPIQRQPRFEIPEVNLGVFDTRMELLKEKYKNDPYYNQQPQLIKLPKDTRISPFELAKKGKTLYDLYNKAQKIKTREEVKERRLPVAEPVDSDTIDRSEFPIAQVDDFEDVDPDEIPMGEPASPPDRDETKYDDTKPKPPSRRPPTKPQTFDPSLRGEEPSIAVLQDEVEDTSERGRVRPSRDFGEPETFDPTPQGVVPSIADIEQVDTTREWIDNWVGRFDRIEEDPADYSDDWDDMHPIVNHPSSEVHEPYTFRPIQAIDQFGDPFFVPSVLGRVDPMFPTQQAPERQIMEDDPIDEPVNIYL